jgi:hypothetical protein
MRGDLSGLSDARLRGWLKEVRRIAALDDAAALADLDTSAWSISGNLCGLVG